MPDFEQLVRQKLRWNRGEQAEVVCELAAHLEDRYEALRRVDLCSDRALVKALSDAGDWETLRKSIVSARGGAMTERAKQILIPGLVALAISCAGESLLWQLHLGRLWWGVGALYVFEGFSWLTASVPMLCILVVAGAAGSLCSLYLGGSKRERIWAAEFPVICSLATIVLLFVCSLVTETLILRHAMDWPHIAAWLPRQLVMAILLPAIALFAGALPFLVVGSVDRRPKGAASSRA